MSIATVEPGRLHYASIHYFHKFSNLTFFIISTKSNRSGGVQGGISNGENIVVRVAFKPTSTIGQEQSTVTRNG